jgi:acetolactate synthase-1/2/3 large subunit
VLNRLRRAERPVLLVGSGIHLAGAHAELETVIRKLGIPVALAWTAIDLLASDDPLYGGRPGTVGDRAGNFTVQNADVLLVVGSRLNIRQVSYNWRSFARCAFKIQVDADPAELDKPTVKPDLAICSDARAFLAELDRQIDRAPQPAGRHQAWLAWCRERVRRYPAVLPRHRVVRDRFVNPYDFIDRLFRHLASDDVVMCGDGSASVVTFQAAVVKQGQRVIGNSGCAAMGYDLPAAIGAAAARGGKRVICIAGDGSIQLNIQELQTLAHHRWPLKLFVLDNGGYLSMRLTQTGFFKRLVGESPRSGISFPSLAVLASAYGLPSGMIEGADFERSIVTALDAAGPFVSEVLLDPAQEFEPKLSSKVLPDGRIVSPPLEDLSPFLDREEFRSNLIIPPLPE